MPKQGCITRNGNPTVITPVINAGIISGDRLQTGDYKLKIGIPAEIHPGEKRIAASPEMVDKLIDLGFEVVVESGAGAGADFSDEVFLQAGATIARDTAEAVRQAGAHRVATLVLPADVSWGDNPSGAEPAVTHSGLHTVPDDRLEDAVARLESGRECTILVGGVEIDTRRGEMLGQLAKTTGAPLSGPSMR